MEVETICGLAFTGVGLVLMAVFRLLEHHQARRLLYLLTEERRPAWATWPLCIAATLFVPGTVLAAAGHLVSRRLVGGATAGGRGLHWPGVASLPGPAEAASSKAGDGHAHQASPL